MTSVERTLTLFARQEVYLPWIEFVLGEKMLAEGLSFSSARKATYTGGFDCYNLMVNISTVTSDRIHM